MSELPGVVRSYQRLFAPDRRIYAVDGRTLPIPGGVPLRWLAAATTSLLVVLALAAGSPLIVAAAGVSAGACAGRLGRRRLAVAVGAATTAGAATTGVVLATLEWPLRLIVVPAALATLLTQVSVDGRPAHRFACSWLRARVAGRRRLACALPVRGRSRRWECSVRVLPDAHGAWLSRARVTGPGRVRFAAPVLLVSDRGRRRAVRPLEHQARGLLLDVVELGEGERLEIRP
jgi:hypothetical protein